MEWPSASWKNAGDLFDAVTDDAAEERVHCVLVAASLASRRDARSGKARSRMDMEQVPQDRKVYRAYTDCSAGVRAW